MSTFENVEDDIVGASASCEGKQILDDRLLAVHVSASTRQFGKREPEFVFVDTQPEPGVDESLAVEPLSNPGHSSGW